MAARAFIGMVAHYSLIRELFSSVDGNATTAGNMDAREASRLMVSIWLDGMSAKAAKSNHSPASRKRNSRKAAKEALPQLLQEATQ
jgi:hypothetical protein